MAASTSAAVSGVQVVSKSKTSLYDSLNGRYHKAALMGLTMLVLGHWSEHLVQAYQVFILHWPRPKALGLLGLWYPWLIRSEWLHFTFVILTLIAIWVLRKGFSGLAYKWWMATFVIAFWHAIEHTGLLYQAVTHHYWFHSPVPCSLVQVWVPRVELHLIYNTMVTVPMAMGMYYHIFPPEGEEDQHANCTCAWHMKDDGADSMAA